MSNSKYNANTTPLFLRHNILPFEKIIKQGKLLFMHSVQFEYCPKSFTNVWSKNSDRQGNIQLRNEHLFDLPNPRIDLFKRLTLYSLPSEWNNCENLMFYENRFTFKTALREQLFKELEDS